MTQLEHELARVLHERAGTVPEVVEPPVGLGSEARTRRTRKLVALVAAGAALVVVLTVAALSALSSDHHATPAVTTGPVSGPRAVLAENADQQIVVLAGPGAPPRPVGRLSSGDASTGFAVTPDGRAAYFDRGAYAPNECAARVARLDVRTATETTVARGLQPGLSPDGRRLAYLTCGGGNPFSDQLVVRDLRTGNVRRLRAPGTQFNRPSWAPDSQHLAVQVVGGAESVVVLDGLRATSIAGGRPVVFQTQSGLSWLGYRGTSGEFWASWNPAGESAGDPAAPKPFYVVAIDARTGATLRTLLQLDYLQYGGLAQQSCCSTVAVDRTGRQLLAWRNAAGGGGLFVATEGASTLAKVGDGNYLLAAWLPRPAR